MTDRNGPRLKWEPAFLAAFSKGATTKDAARAAGIAPSTAFSRRKSNDRFAREWAAAAKAAEAFKKAGGRAVRSNNWKNEFLDALAETSNVSASAASVNVPTRTVYELRRDDPVFAAGWLRALREGYEHLEMEVLGHLRDPKPERKMDVTAALRLLAAHRDTVERQRAFEEDEEDEEESIRSLDLFLHQMRERRAANAEIMRETDRSDGAR